MSTSALVQKEMPVAEIPVEASFGHNTWRAHTLNNRGYSSILLYYCKCGGPPQHFGPAKLFSLQILTWPGLHSCTAGMTYSARYKKVYLLGTGVA